MSTTHALSSPCAIRSSDAPIFNFSILLFSVSPSFSRNSAIASLFPTWGVLLILAVAYGCDVGVDLGIGRLTFGVGMRDFGFWLLVLYGEPGALHRGGE